MYVLLGMYLLHTHPNQLIMSRPVGDLHMYTYVTLVML